MSYFHDRRSCYGKKIWWTDGDAASWAVRLRVEHGIHQEPYRCPVCKLWHLRTVGRKHETHGKL